MARDIQPLPIDHPDLDRELAAIAAKYLQERAVPKPWAAACGIHVNNDEVRGKEHPLLGFQYFDIATGKPDSFFRWRQWDPERDDWLIGDRKFIQPKGSPVRVYAPPLREKGKIVPMARILRDPRRDLVIAEGETRALVLNYHGIACVAIGGIWSFGSRNSDDVFELCEDMRNINMRGRRVTLLVDADVGTHSQKQEAALRCARLLKDA